MEKKNYSFCIITSLILQIQEFWVWISSPKYTVPPYSCCKFNLLHMTGWLPFFETDLFAFFFFLLLCAFESTNSHPCFKSHLRIFLRLPGDVSSFCCVQSRCFFSFFFLRRPADISVDFFGDQNRLFNQKRYFKSNHDDFLTLTKCLNLSRAAQRGDFRKFNPSK